MPTKANPKNNNTPQCDFDAVVVGAGFSGLYMLHRLRASGLRVKVYERGADVGGTWYWNRYPGARCDIESIEYSYQFSEELAQEWEWSERYATQPEILKYLNHVADRFDLRSDIQFNSAVTRAIFDDASSCWKIEIEDGVVVSANFLITGVGILSTANKAPFKGMDSFAGDIYFTGAWPHDAVDFSDKRVGVIGTGSSAIQSIPIIAEQARELLVFQRTPNYSVPAHNRPLDPDQVATIKANYGDYIKKAKTELIAAHVHSTSALSSTATPEERQQVHEQRWAIGGFAYLFGFADLLFDHEQNQIAAEFIRSKIKETVTDPAIAEKLLPTTPIACKRLCVDTDYYQTYNRENVHLIDINETPIVEITPTGLKTSDQEYQLDSLVMAIGFDAITGSLFNMNIQGRGGVRLEEKWEAGPRTYLGIATADFPNMFIITGPGSPSTHINVVRGIEQHVDWIGDCIDYMRANKLKLIEAQPEEEIAWTARVQSIIENTIFTGCDSWYVGANIPGKPRVFTAYLGFPDYSEQIEKVAMEKYRGFSLLA